jgi:hypothetical protein
VVKATLTKGGGTTVGGVGGVGGVGAALTAWVSGLDRLCGNGVVLYTATTVCVPALRELVVNVAVSPFSVPLPATEPSIRNVTLPVGVFEPGTRPSVAVNVAA